MTRTTLLTTMLILGGAIWPNMVDAEALKPLDPERFFVTPNQPAVLRWQVESGTLDGPVEATIRDYWGNTVATTPTKVTAEDTLELTVKLAPGFYDVELPAAEQRFGIMSLEAYQGDPDPFFSIDAAMSWLVRTDEVRRSLIKVLKRSGVAMSRERLNWGQISPAQGKWDWDSPAHYETIRKAYAAHEVEVLEMFHGATRWSGQVGKYPEDLPGTARAWQAICRRWRPTWGAMEVWNEPDISFGAFLPADQYVPLVKAIAYGFARAGSDVPIVGGVFATYKRPFLDNAARNGLLDCVDAVSFHTYGRAPGMEELIGKYRSWLGAHGQPAMPLWLTECGRPWRRGPDRPPAEQDAESALDITMKAIESRACGVARYFAFVYPFYEERESNFGLMGRHATPLRSMAAYARLTSLLAHKRYLGDLKCQDAAIQRARVFGDQRETIAAVYTGRLERQAKLKLDLPVLRVEGIDGRKLHVAEDAAVPVPDGLVYVWLDRTKLGERLVTDTPAMRLWTIGQQEGPHPKAPSPIILRHQFDPDLLEAKSEGYRVKQQAPQKVPLTIRVFNLSEKARDVRLWLCYGPPQGTRSVLALEEHEVRAPPEGSVDLAWELDLTKELAAAGRIEATVTAIDKRAPGSAPEPLARLEIDLIGL